MHHYNKTKVEIRVDAHYRSLRRMLRCPAFFENLALSLQSRGLHNSKILFSECRESTLNLQGTGASQAVLAAMEEDDPDSCPPEGKKKSC